MIKSCKWMLASLVLAPASGSLYYWLNCAAPLAEDSPRGWKPNAAAIRSELALLPPAKNEAATEARRNLFARRFNQRYRTNARPLAVCLRFLPDGRIKLMCPARLEPWKLDCLAQAAWSETRENFGRGFDIDIYETYIGAATVKIGELRADPDRPKTALIVYHYPARPQSVSASL